jgi:hypothetical protein
MAARAMQRGAAPREMYGEKNSSKKNRKKGMMMMMMMMMDVFLISRPPTVLFKL